MKVGEYNLSKKQVTIMALLVLGLIVGVYLVLGRQIFKSRAATSGKPFEVFQNTDPGQSNICTEEGCTTNSLDVTIRLKKEIEGQNQPIPAVLR